MHPVQETGWHKRENGLLQLCYHSICKKQQNWTKLKLIALPHFPRPHPNLPCYLKYRSKSWSYIKQPVAVLSDCLTHLDESIHKYFTISRKSFKHYRNKQSGTYEQKSSAITCHGHLNRSLLRVESFSTMDSGTQLWTDKSAAANFNIQAHNSTSSLNFE